MYNFFAITLMSNFSTSTATLPDCFALSFLICLMDSKIFSINGEVNYIGRLVCAASTSGGFNGVGLLKNFSRFLTYLSPRS